MEVNHILPLLLNCIMALTFNRWDKTALYCGYRTAVLYRENVVIWGSHV